MVQKYFNFQGLSITDVTRHRDEGAVSPDILHQTQTQNMFNTIMGNVLIRGQ